MSLFGQLHDDAFLLFSRTQRYFYARVVVDLFRRFFSDTVSFPARTEVVAAIYDVLRTNPDLWHEGEDGAEEEISTAPDLLTRGRRLRRGSGAEDASPAQDALLGRAWRAYNRLVETGWLEEEAYGLRVTVDMPPGALLLADRLTAIEGGLSASFRGVVSLIRGSLSSALTDLEREDAQGHAPGAAAGVHKAAEMAVGFSREMRMVLATLRGLEKDILASETLKDRMGMFFREFIGRLVLKDFESIYKTNHPYRFKDEILAALDRLEEDAALRGLMIDGYVGAEICSKREAAGEQLNGDLFTLRMVFDNIDQTYERINAFRVRLETRLRNTLKYADLGDSRHAGRIGALVARIDGALAEGQAAGLDDLPEARVPLFGDHAPWSPAALREPLTPRPPVTSDTFQTRQPDAAAMAYRDLLRRYTDLFIVRPDQVIRYLDRHLLPGHTAEARYLPLESVEDLLAFEHLRRYRVAPPPGFTRVFTITPCPDGSWRDDAWLRCPNFRIYRHLEERGQDPASENARETSGPETPL